MTSRCLDRRFRPTCAASWCGERREDRRPTPKVSPLTSHPFGSPSRSPSVATAFYTNIIGQVVQAPERVSDPELVQYIPDACALLGSTDLRLREILLQLIGLFTMNANLKKEVLSSTAELLLHMVRMLAGAEQ